MEGNATSSSFAVQTLRRRSNNFLVSSQDTSTFVVTILSSILSSLSRYVRSICTGLALGRSLKSPDFAELVKVGEHKRRNWRDFSGENVCNDKGLHFVKLALIFCSHPLLRMTLTQFPYHLEVSKSGSLLFSRQGFDPFFRANSFGVCQSSAL